tara:strand:+ start:533 stop:1303 length:771 start_codon:yes stop_codon:yes gene_type:complete
VITVWFAVIKRKWDNIDATKRKVSDEGHVEGFHDRKETFSHTLPAGEYLIMDGKSFVGEKFNGKLIDKRKSTKYTEMKYPPKRDERGRLVEERVSRKEAKDSNRSGRTGRSKFEGVAQAGQKKTGQYELDLSKPEPKPSGKGKFTMKTGKRNTPIRLKKISFKRCDFKNAIFAFYRKQDPAGVIKLCNFSRASFINATLGNVVFEDCDLRGVDLTKCNIKGEVILRRCNVRGASVPKSIKMIEPKNKDKMFEGKRK